MSFTKTIYVSFACLGINILFLLPGCHRDETAKENSNQSTEKVEFVDVVNKLNAHLQTISKIDGDIDHASLVAMLDQVNTLFQSVSNDEIPSSVASEFKEARNKFEAGFKLISVAKDKQIKEVDAFDLFGEAWERFVEKAIENGLDLDVKNMVQKNKHEAKVSATLVAMSSLNMACTAYRLDTSAYPKSLKDLVNKPETERRWRGPYVDAKNMDYLKDPWGTKFRYSTDEENNRVIIRSAGPDQKFDTDDDIVSD